jgi:hypothetical protein
VAFLNSEGNVGVVGVVILGCLFRFYHFGFVGFKFHSDCFNHLALKFDFGSIKADIFTSPILEIFRVEHFGYRFGIGLVQDETFIVILEMDHVFFVFAFANFLDLDPLDCETLRTFIREVSSL